MPDLWAGQRQRKSARTNPKSASKSARTNPKLICAGSAGASLAGEISANEPKVCPEIARTNPKRDIVQAAVTLQRLGSMPAAYLCRLSLGSTELAEVRESTSFRGAKGDIKCHPRNALCEPCPKWHCFEPRPSGLRFTANQCRYSSLTRRVASSRPPQPKRPKNHHGYLVHVQRPAVSS